MQKVKFFAFTILLLWGITGCKSQSNIQPQEVQPMEEINTPTDCPITDSKSTTFKAPAPYTPDAPFPNEFWFGTEHLWTALPENGIWANLPHNSEGYTQKIAWWSSLFSVEDEPEPDLVVFGERLDAIAPPLKVSRATNATAEDIGSVMMVGVDFPTTGCWKITGQYKKAELTFVLQISQ